MTPFVLPGCRVVDETALHRIERIGRGCFWTVRKIDDRIVGA